MELSPIWKDTFLQILREELIPAMGCTEPIAIAYGAARAREVLGCLPEEVVFTSCGTEGDNWAIAAAVEKNRRKGKHIITTAIEHAAVLEPIRELERQGYEVTWLQPDQQGIITAEQVEAALRPDTILVAMMLVNNEPGGRARPRHPCGPLPRPAPL